MAMCNETRFGTNLHIISCVAAGGRNFYRATVRSLRKVFREGNTLLELFVRERTVVIPKNGHQGNPDTIACLNTTYKLYTCTLYLYLREQE